MIETHKCAARGRGLRRAHRVRRVLNDPREKGSSSKKPRRSRADGLITLHDASLGLYMHVAVQKVNR
jgi:hypothetical protein